MVTLTPPELSFRLGSLEVLDLVDPWVFVPVLGEGVVPWAAPAVVVPPPDELVPPPDGVEPPDGGCVELPLEGAVPVAFVGWMASDEVDDDPPPLVLEAPWLAWAWECKLWMAEDFKAPSTEVMSATLAVSSRWRTPWLGALETEAEWLVPAGSADGTETPTGAKAPPSTAPMARAPTPPPATITAGARFLLRRAARLECAWRWPECSPAPDLELLPCG